MRAIYKICTPEQWSDALRQGQFTGSEVDLRDGFIHFSTSEQVAESAANCHLTGLVLVIVDWEPSRGGALFPHLYAPLDTSAAISVTELPDGEARAAFLDGLPDR